MVSYKSEKYGTYYTCSRLPYCLGSRSEQHGTNSADYILTVAMQKAKYYFSRALLWSEDEFSTLLEKVGATSDDIEARYEAMDRLIDHFRALSGWNADFLIGAQQRRYFTLRNEVALLTSRWPTLDKSVAIKTLLLPEKVRRYDELALDQLESALASSADNSRRSANLNGYELMSLKNYLMSCVNRPEI